MISNCTSSIGKIMSIVALTLVTLTASAQMDFNTATSLSESNGVSKTIATVLMMDQGVGSLQNGMAEIKLNPAIASLIDGDRIDDMVTLSIQLEGESNGVYVTKKNKDSFIITELLEGSSNASFSYEIVVKDI